MITRKIIESISNEFEIKECEECKEVVLNVFKKITFYTVCGEKFNSYENALMCKNKCVAHEALRVWDKLILHNVTYYVIRSEEELDIFKTIIVDADQPADIFCDEIDVYPIIAYCVQTEISDDGAIENQIIQYNINDLKIMLSKLSN